MNLSDKQKQELRRIIAGVHNLLFKNIMIPEDIELELLTDMDTEAEILLPTFGINPRLWSRWTVEKQLEVLIHEFAHVHDYEQNHRPPFWDRVVNMVHHVEQFPDQLESLLNNPVDFSVLKRKVVESVHEEVIDRRMDSVRNRRKALRRSFDIDNP